MSILKRTLVHLRDVAKVAEHVDTKEAAKTIRDNMNFRGPNVWILAFSVVIACVGLNINSIPVIIGAMLISPLMGPIYAIGLGLGTNDVDLIKHGFENLVIMVGIALIASTAFFVISPLNFANPTELEARTHPTIYDILIAFFGGLAGIFEISRKGVSRSTVLAGVAIATALMPPLCTAGYGIAKMNPHFFFGALLLFCINLIFISLATYVMVKYLGFEQFHDADSKTIEKHKRIITIAVIIVTIPSLWSAVNMVIYNNFQLKVRNFVSVNKELDRAYIYDCKTENKKGGIATIYIAGETLKSDTKLALQASAASFGIKENQLIIKEHNLISDEGNDSEILMKGIYERTDAEINRKEMQIRELERELNNYRSAEIPYVQIAKELQAQYPEISQVSISKGETVQLDSLASSAKSLIVVAASQKPLDTQKAEKIETWLRVRLADTTVVLINPRPDAKK